MNSIVSVASLASASAITSPALSQETTADRRAMVARAEQIVGCLRNRFVCGGWHEHFDEQRAAEFLDAVRREDYSADNDPAQAFVSSWMRDHGQSLDWLYEGDPDGLICHAAAGSSAAAAIPTGPDPIFAAIEQHRETWKAIEIAVHEQSEAEGRWFAEGNTLTPSFLMCTREQWDSNPAQPFPWPFGEHSEFRLYRGSDINRFFANADSADFRKEVRAGLTAIKRKHRAIFGPIMARVRAAHEADEAARWRLATTQPTTLAGIAAVLQYVSEKEKTDGMFLGEDEHAEFYASLSAAMAMRDGQLASAA